MAFKVIVDTSVIKNEKLETFLGGREELQLFSQWADIVIPQMVIQEIENSKRKYLRSKRNSFLSNIFLSLMQVDENRTKNFDIENLIDELRNNEDITYELIELTDYMVLEDMKELALKNVAPFDSGTDKGFKDAYIYFTILEYLSDIGNEQVFFVTEDARLTEAFKNNNSIKVIKNFKEFVKHTGIRLSSEYFLRNLSDKLRYELTAESIIEKSSNKDGDWVLTVSTNEGTHYVIVDFARDEIVKSTSFDLHTEIENLIISGSFERTHTCIENIKNYTDYFSIDQIKNLIKAATENSQINWIAIDEDVKGFFLSIYEDSILANVPKETRKIFETIFPIAIARNK